MSRPWKHPRTNVYWFRKAVPADLRSIIGKREELRSLQTKDPAVARLRHAAIAAEVEKRWSALRQPSQPLSHKQIVALSGLVYRGMVDGHEENPGSSSMWQGFIAFQNKTLHPDRIKEWLGPIVDAVLLREGIRTDEASRERLIEEVRRASNQAAEQLKRNAEGDYRPDPDGARFPEWSPPRNNEPHQGKGSPTAGGKVVTLTGILEGWWREAKAGGRSSSTYQSYSATITKLAAFLGHEDARYVTPEDVVRFKDHRLSEINPRTGKPASPKTVKDSDLAGLKAVFGWAVTNRLLPSNPAQGITVKVGKPKRLRLKGFTDAEANAILKAARELQQGKENSKTFAAKRWVPWLQAYTGARVGEMAQLRKQDLRNERGVWVLTVTPEAGTVKTGEAREIPLHPHLVELGFPDFVRSCPEGHLFLNPRSGEGDDDYKVLGPLQGVKNRLAEFARDVVGDPRVQPTHGWRHRFKTLWREAGLDPRIMDVIQGHAARTAGDDYGDVTIKAMAASLAKFPRQGELGL